MSSASAFTTLGTTENMERRCGTGLKPIPKRSSHLDHKERIVVLE